MLLTQQTCASLLAAAGGLQDDAAKLMLHMLLAPMSFCISSTNNAFAYEHMVLASQLQDAAASCCMLTERFLMD